MPDALRIVPVESGRERYRDLLLLADEQWDMVECYLRKGEMFAAYAELELAAADGPACDPSLALGCVIAVDEGVDRAGRRLAEVKSLAVAPAWQRRGVGRALLAFTERRLAPRFDVLQVGTGDSPLTVPFYEACGFARSHVLPNFFTDNYDQPIFEAGVQLKDMVYLQKEL